MSHLQPEKITPEHLYLSRRKFIVGAGMVTAAAFLAACGNPGTTQGSAAFCDGTSASSTVDELGENLTSCEDITQYNNFYEFSLDKYGIGSLAQSLVTSPWTVTIGGLVDKPVSMTVADLIKKYSPEERIYRLRCVEAWSMVIPWKGFPLSRLLQDVKPQPEAKFVRFVGLLDVKQMPGQTNTSFPWPYTEGLRLDEAMEDLTILATGLYNKPLPPQDGAPIRLVVPWKYGFKNIKCIVKIDLVSEMPLTFWPEIAPSEYGFYANVNPNVNHPRWSQASERRIGEASRQRTLLFNGYDQVAPLYAGMDLTKNF